MHKKSQVFHFDTETWSRGPDLPEKAVAHTLLDLEDGRVLLQPGYRGDTTSDCYVFDIEIRPGVGSGIFPAV